MSRSLSTIQEKSLELNVKDLCRESLQKLIDLGLVLQTKSLPEDPADQNVVHSLEVTPLENATVKGRGRFALCFVLPQKYLFYCLNVLILC